MKADPVSVDPDVDLDAWAIVVSPLGTAHFAGAREGRDRGRLSTAIESFDLGAMAGTTASGRTYRLAGARNDVLGLTLATIFWGREAAKASSYVSPEDLELVLARPANGMGA